MRTKHLFLTSILATGVACPVMAEDIIIETGDMCSANSFGILDNNYSANVEAIWELDTKTCTAGTYYNASTNSCVQCVAGNFCTGGGTYDVEHNQTGDGMTSCSTLSGGYNSSLAGATTNKDCYKPCVVSDIDHTLTISGNVYYNGIAGKKRCSATSCDTGYHLQSWVNLPTTINNTAGLNSGHISAYNDSFSETGNNGQSYYGISNSGEWAVDYGQAGMLYGTSVCSNVSGDNNDYTWTNPSVRTTSELGLTTGKYCYCGLIGYKFGNSALQSFSSYWVYNFDNGDNCELECAYNCAYNMRGVDSGNINFRNALFEATIIPVVSCEANNIFLEWYNDTVSNNGTTITPNNSGATQCTYNEQITVPTNTMQKVGYTFSGWKLRTNN